MKTYARDLRRKQTDAEIKLWKFLRNRKFYDFKFRRQYWIENYIVDFICIERKLIIELDGGQHNEPLQEEYDQQRSKRLKELGFKIIRFCNDDVFFNTDEILDEIFRNLVGMS